MWWHDDWKSQSSQVYTIIITAKGRCALYVCVVEGTQTGIYAYSVFCHFIFRCISVHFTKSCLMYTTHYSCDSIFIRNEFTHTHIYPGHFTLTRVDKKMYFNYHGISWYYNGVQNTKYTYGTMMLIQLYSAPVLSLVTLQYGCT
jgi:hypothetical protein